MSLSEPPQEIEPRTNHVKQRQEIPYWRVISIMQDRGISTIQEMANRCGVSRPLISAVLHGHVVASHNLKLKMASVLRCDSRVLFP